MVPRDLARVNEPTAHRDVRFGSLAGQMRTFGAYEALPARSEGYAATKK